MTKRQKKIDYVLKNRLVVGYRLDLTDQEYLELIVNENAFGLIHLCASIADIKMNKKGGQ